MYEKYEKLQVIFLDFSSFANIIARAIYLRYLFFKELSMFKRVLYFVLTNMAVMVVISIVIAVISALTGMNLYSDDLLSVAIFSGVVGFAGAFISLALSRWSAKKMYNIILIDASKKNQISDKEALVYDIVERLSQQNNITTPEVWVYENTDPNAFATGATKNSSLVAVSSGLLDQMTKDEIEGVIAHEMGHILNGDMVTMTLLQGVLNTFVVFLARIIAQIIDNATDGKLWFLGYQAVYIILQVFLGIGATMIAMSFSRHREYRADIASAQLVGKAKMIAALKRLKGLYPETVSTDDGKLAAFKISSADKATLFASHPSLDARIKALEENYTLS